MTWAIIGYTKIFEQIKINAVLRLPRSENSEKRRKNMSTHLRGAIVSPVYLKFSYSSTFYNSGVP